MFKPTPIPPQPGQESVWDYPRPAVCEPVSRHVAIVFSGQTIAETRTPVRVLETSHPPSYYLPPDAFAAGVLRPNPQRSFCEWKGQAIYYDIVVGDRVETAAAWAYPNPSPSFTPLKDFVAVYPARMEACLVDGIEARPQDGEFYGGWITPDVVGPFKGGPGTRGW